MSEYIKHVIEIEKVKKTKSTKKINTEHIKNSQFLFAFDLIRNFEI